MPTKTMPIKIYNTLSKSKETFEPVTPGEVGIYLCGPTVYKPSHIGHMVGPVIFDAVKRYLAYSGYRVTLVINITDVDDKLIVESQARQMTMAALAEEMTADYMRNLAAMGVDTVDHFPKATAHIDDILAITQSLIDQGFAYASGGDVYFDVSRDADYGKLTNRSLEAIQGEGGSTAERKRNAADFALWKSAKPGEPSWPSPWGPGRPGWHIECSAMSHKLLGKTFDIHGGGLDLAFPHHENEIAQSESCHGQPQAKYWMHNGLMQSSSEVGKVGGRNTRAAGGECAASAAGTAATECATSAQAVASASCAAVAEDQAAQEAGKIGKSKGASAFRELLARYPGETIRFFLLASHYRRPIDYSEQRIDEVGVGLQGFYRFFERFTRLSGHDFYQLDYAKLRRDPAPAASPLMQAVLESRQKFLDFMDDDFNTGGAIGELFELLRLLNRFVEAEKLEDVARRSAPEGQQALAELTVACGVLREVAATLGLFRAPVVAVGTSGDDTLVGKLLDLFVVLRADVRSEAKASKNKQLFSLADKIRDQLTELGVALEDRADGTSWTLKR